MVDPVTTPPPLLVLGKLAEDLLLDACKDHVKGKVSTLLSRLEDTGDADELQSAYEDALKHAYHACLESLLGSIRTCGYSDDELRRYRSPVTISRGLHTGQVSARTGSMSGSLPSPRSLAGGSVAEWDYLQMSSRPPCGQDARCHNFPRPPKVALPLTSRRLQPAPRISTIAPAALHVPIPARAA